MSLSGFFDMGGYAFYVWGSYAVTAALMLLEVVWLARRRRTLLDRLGRMQGTGRGGAGER